MKKKLIKDTSAHFAKLFDAEPESVFLSPGRINLIGEHVDYNDGFVLPAAINKYLCFAISVHDTTHCTLVAKDLNEAYKFDLNDPIVPVEKMWVNYILGVVSQLKDAGHALKGFDMVFSSTIPMGAGLSSSAALECGVGYALNDLFSLGLTKERIAQIGQQSEHTFVGVKCGIMDQFASVFGKKKHVVELDCTSLGYTYHKADFDKYALLLIDSNVKHTHLTSGYNVRRQEVEHGLSVIKKHFPQVNTFRDCTMEMVNSLEQELGDVVLRRCRFVVGEIQRVREAVDALEAENFIRFGQLMYGTHLGLSQDYEVSCPEIDFLVAYTGNIPQVIGSRMMGGGFGGCSINLVEKGFEDALIDELSAEYAKTFGITLKAYKVKIAKGTTRYKDHENIR